jgi:DNA-directed RNA polymerase specialized sigma24 family protein
LSEPIAERRFREIVPPLLDDAYTLAKWLSQSPTDAEDIVQDAALGASSSLQRFSRSAETMVSRHRSQRRHDLHGAQSAEDRGLCRRHGRP